MGRWFGNCSWEAYEAENCKVELKGRLGMFVLAGASVDFGKTFLELLLIRSECLPRRDNGPRQPSARSELSAEEGVSAHLSSLLHMVRFSPKRRLRGFRIRGSSFQSCRTASVTGDHLTERSARSTSCKAPHSDGTIAARTFWVALPV